MRSAQHAARLAGAEFRRRMLTSAAPGNLYEPPLLTRSHPLHASTDAGTRPSQSLTKRAP
jgi:hypothetical protein